MYNNIWYLKIKNWLGRKILTRDVRHTDNDCEAKALVSIIQILHGS